MKEEGIYLNSFYEASFTLMPKQTKTLQEKKRTDRYSAQTDVKI